MSDLNELQSIIDDKQYFFISSGVVYLFIYLFTYFATLPLNSVDRQTSAQGPCLHLDHTLSCFHRTGGIPQYSSN